MNKEIIKNELLSIHSREGCLKPLSVIKEAESEDSPLHSYFEWDDSIAAHSHRLWQARQLIRTVKIQVEDSPQNIVHQFIHVRDEMDGPRYQTREIVLADTDLHANALELAKIKLQSASKSLEELVNVSKTTPIKKSRQNQYSRASRLVNQAQNTLFQ